MVYLKFRDGKALCECVKEEISPLDYVLMGVALCLGSELVDMEKQSDVEKVGISFGNGTIRILCPCGDPGKVSLMKAVSDCFIIQNLKFKVSVDFNTPLPDTF